MMAKQRKPSGLDLIGPYTNDYALALKWLEDDVSEEAIRRLKARCIRFASESTGIAMEDAERYVAYRQDGAALEEGWSEAVDKVNEVYIRAMIHSYWTCRYIKEAPF